MFANNGAEESAAKGGGIGNDGTPRHDQQQNNDCSLKLGVFGAWDLELKISSLLTHHFPE
jgi:hypothetical protein